MDGDAGLGGDAGCYSFGEFHSIHRERMAGGDGARVCLSKQNRTRPAHFLLQQPGGQCSRTRT